MNNKNNHYDKVLFITDGDGNVLGFYRHDLNSRSMKLYSCQEMSMEDIKDMHDKLERKVYELEKNNHEMGKPKD